MPKCGNLLNLVHIFRAFSCTAVIVENALMLKLGTVQGNAFIQCNVVFCSNTNKNSMHNVIIVNVSIGCSDCLQGIVHILEVMLRRGVMILRIQFGLKVFLYHFITRKTLPFELRSFV